MNIKNPKDIAGTDRLDLTLVNPIAQMEEALAMTEGMLKYGRNNYIGTAVVYMIYMGAAFRHMWKHIQGEERDAKTGVHHLGSARACLGILIEAAAHGKLIDNRPPSLHDYSARLDGMERRVAHLKTLFADKDPYHFTIADSKEKPIDDHDQVAG